MRISPLKVGAQLLVSLILVAVTTASASTPTPPALPNPVLFLIEQEPFQQGGKEFIRYKLAVDNYASFPDAMFAAAPALPPCGTNTKSSRTWVDIYDQRGKRLYGFCALGKASALNTIWFALPADEVPPSWVYIEFNDRQTSTKYKSNLTETTL
jgi:hypothetical protein